jgi:hypothetical protein
MLHLSRCLTNQVFHSDLGAFTQASALFSSKITAILARVTLDHFDLCIDAISEATPDARPDVVRHEILDLVLTQNAHVSCLSN